MEKGQGRINLINKSAKMKKLVKGKRTNEEQALTEDAKTMWHTGQLLANEEQNRT